MYHLIYECHITCVFCIPFTYVLLGNKYLFIVIVIVIVIWLFIHRICWRLHVDDLLSFCLFASCVISGILVTLHQGTLLEYIVCSTSLMASLWVTRYLLEYYVNMTQTVRDISPLMPIHQDPLLVSSTESIIAIGSRNEAAAMTVYCTPNKWFICPDRGSLGRRLCHLVGK